MFEWPFLLSSSTRIYQVGGFGLSGLLDYHMHDIAVVTGYRCLLPFSPPVPALIFIAHRVQYSFPLLVDFDLHPSTFYTRYTDAYARGI